MTSKFTIDDIVTKRLTVDGKRIQSLNLGTLVVIDPSYNVVESAPASHGESGARLAALDRRPEPGGIDEAPHVTKGP